MDFTNKHHGPFSKKKKLNQYIGKADNGEWYRYIYHTEDKSAEPKIEHLTNKTVLTKRQTAKLRIMPDKKDISNTLKYMEEVKNFPKHVQTEMTAVAKKPLD